MKETKPFIATNDIIHGHFIPCSWPTSKCWIRLINYRCILSWLQTGCKIVLLRYSIFHYSYFSDLFWKTVCCKCCSSDNALCKKQFDQFISRQYSVMMSDIRRKTFASHIISSRGSVDAMVHHRYCMTFSKFRGIMSNHSWK